jgi:hypothetical protein
MISVSVELDDVGRVLTSCSSHFAEMEANVIVSDYELFFM